MSSVPAGRSHNPPQRSQYFNSRGMISRSSGSTIASLRRPRFAGEPRLKWKRPCADFSVTGPVSVTENLVGYLVRDRASRLSLPEVALLIAGLQHAPVLDHDADLSGELQRPQKLFHGRRKHFRAAYLAA